MRPGRLTRRWPALLGAVALLWTSGCSWYPQPVEGLPTAGPWIALPLRRWLAENRAVPEAVAACFDAACPHRLAVAVIRAGGSEAETLSALLDDPSPLARRLGEPPPSPNPRRSSPRLRVEVARLQADPFEGFTLTLGRLDGTRSPVHAAVLGHRFGATLRFVMVIGTEAEAVEATARRVAAEHIGL